VKQTVVSLLVLAVLPLAAFGQDAADTAPPVVAPGGLTAPPAPDKPRPVTVPAPVVRTLTNGLRVVTVPRPGSGLVTVEVLVRSGGARDPDGKAGLANLTADLLTRGAGGRTAPQFAEAIEALGTGIGTGAGWDGSTASMTVIRPRLAQAMPLLASAVLSPTFAPAEVERRRREVLDDLSVSLREPGTIARFAAARALYGTAPYGHPLGGSPSSLRAITRADVAAFHRTHYRPDNAALLIVGDVTVADAAALAQKTFGGWKRPASPAPAPLPAFALQSIAGANPRVVVIDKPDAGQAAVFVIRPGIRRDDPGYYRGEVANAVLGNGFSSRLNYEVRIKRGLSYGAGSRVDARRYVGPFLASCQTKNPSAGEVAELILDQMRRLGTGPLTAAELSTRRPVLEGDFSRSLETAGGLTGLVAEQELYGRPLAELNRYLPTIRAVTPDQARAFARAHMSPAGATVVIVGDARQFLPDLKKRLKGSPVEVIPEARLDLNRPTLRRP
jgi:zinc protease